MLLRKREDIEKDRDGLMIKPIQAQPDPGRDDEVSLFFWAPPFGGVRVSELFECAMKAKVESHAHGMSRR